MTTCEFTGFDDDRVEFKLVTAVSKNNPKHLNLNAEISIIDNKKLTYQTRFELAQT